MKCTVRANTTIRHQCDGGTIVINLTEKEEIVVIAINEKKAYEILHSVCGPKRKPTVQEVIDAAEFMIKKDERNVFDLTLFLFAEERLSLDERIEIGNHFNMSDVWDPIIVAGILQMRKGVPLQVKQLEKILQKAKKKGAVLSAITFRLNTIRSDGSLRQSRGPIGLPAQP